MVELRACLKQFVRTCWMAGKDNPADTADGAFRKFWIRISKPAQEQHKGPTVRNNPFGPGGYLEGASSTACLLCSAANGSGKGDEGSGRSCP